MARRNNAKKRIPVRDPRHNSIIVTKFINKLMREGKKHLASNIFYGALEKASTKLNDSAIAVLDQVMANVRPAMELKPCRVGGMTYQVPIEVKEDRADTLAFRWLINSARKTKGKSMIDSLSSILMLSYNNTGPAIKIKEENFKAAESNRAFSHFRWFNR